MRAGFAVLVPLAAVAVVEVSLLDVVPLCVNERGKVNDDGINATMEQEENQNRRSGSVLSKIVKL